MSAQSIEHFGKPVPHRARTDGGYDDAGFAVADGLAAPVDIVAVVQPIADDDLRDMPEGIRIAAQWRVWTRAVIHEDDVLIIDGNDCRILRVLPWSNHREAVVGKAGT